MRESKQSGAKGSARPRVQVIGRFPAWQELPSLAKVPDHVLPLVLVGSVLCIWYRGQWIAQVEDNA